MDDLRFSRRPHYLGFMECLEGAATAVKKPGWQVSVVFDQQIVFASWALKFFEVAKKQSSTPLSKRLGDATFKSKARVGGLQAADMLAHVAYRLFTAEVVGKVTLSRSGSVVSEACSTRW